ncbi:BsuPI-related putative proteinase inhibitor [Alkalibacillus salilacus]|uniref:Intracellular proteinase inhibitor BsuPI domain-containing protein n=1 Tax=Alkalibacillus salilacus TaxID=284582 RepID=A0ABT9VHL4_9BACI|nr:BsuPI-related putative proteinase inhibitor [Alkalibacillus salilacus]MDQ0160320.1 hypothetical protein [Alkalibacillus salilacus]
MRRWLFVLFIISFAVGLVACNGNGEAAGDNEQSESEGNESDNEMGDLVDSFSFDGEAKVEEERVVFNMTLTYEGEEPAELTFPSGQKFDVNVTQADTEKSAYRYSADRSFTQAIQTENLESGDTLEYKDTWEISESPNTVESGKYQAELWLTANQLNGEELSERAFSKTVEFELTKGTEDSEDHQPGEDGDGEEGSE